jgi:hypothetical protein
MSTQMRPPPDIKNGNHALNSYLQNRICKSSRDLEVDRGFTTQHPVPNGFYAQLGSIEEVVTPSLHLPMHEPQEQHARSSGPI